MLKKGTRVTRMTQRVGQHPPEGKIIDVTRDSYEIRWDDGHTSIITPEGIVPVKKPKDS
jgi:hypothetical protein